MSEEEKKEEIKEEENQVSEEEENQEEQEVENKEEEQEEELSNEDIKRLAQSSGEEESKYFLKLSQWDRPGNSFTDWGRIIIVEGEVKMIPIEHIYNYPTTDETQYLILPLTKTVILRHKSYNDYNGDNDVQEVLYVFSAKEGWRSLRL